MPIGSEWGVAASPSHGAAQSGGVSHLWAVSGLGWGGAKAANPRPYKEKWVWLKQRVGVVRGGSGRG